MPYRLEIPDHLTAQGWKVKIRDKERLEPPHVSIMWKHKTWRWNLRTQEFMDKKPLPGQVPAELVEVLEENLDALITAWDKMFSINPVHSEEQDDEDLPAS